MHDLKKSCWPARRAFQTPRASHA